MTRQGFTLIELLVSIAISAMMATLLFQALFQAGVAVDAGDSLMDLSTKTAQVQQLLERDLSAATTLVDNEPPQETDMTKTTTKTVGNKTIKEEKGAKDEPEGKKEKQIIKKLFFSSTGPGGLGTLTFVTNNPLMSFWSSRQGASGKGKPKPYLARVTYTVEEDKASPGSYRLLRQESSILDYEKRSGRSYEVVDGIKSIAVKFTAKTEKIIPAKEEAEKKAKSSDPSTGNQPKKAPAKKQKPKVEVTYTVVNTWDTDQLKEEQKKKTEQKSPQKGAAAQKKEEPEEKKKLIPVQVSVEIAFLDKEKKSERISKIDIGIITDTEFSLPKKPASFVSLLQQQPTTTDQTQQQQQANNQYNPGHQGQKFGMVEKEQSLFDRLNHLGERLANALCPGINQNTTNQNKRIHV